MRVSIKKKFEEPLALDKRSFVLLGMMRSGSNFLERQLTLLPDVMCHGELFNPSFVGFAQPMGNEMAGYQRNDVHPRNREPLKFLRQVSEATTRPIMGFRMFLDHDPEMTARILYDADVKKIVLSRNLLDSYVSLVIARETDQWLLTDVAGRKEAGPITVDLNEFNTFALRQALYFNDILTILIRTGQDFLTLDYTEIKNLARLNEAATFIGSEHRFDVVKEPLKKQNPESLRRKIVNYDELLEQMRRRKMARWFV
ncbi:MAG TPA: hypothetical protein VJM11_14190 [Nevskiaceae bacterium]|nr:hypothetical protein [Nevskiaceae bacterium]